ncbi:hypothetical protein AX15_005428 [Amanita polypyramis BW_CC]|nr:hypothetical protein AX15_005428 [Amanita polypyramis BW_CC]
MPASLPMMSNEGKRTITIEALVEPVLDGSVSDFAGDSTLPPPPILSPAQEGRLWRKIDARLIPILALMYLASFLDRCNARIEGLETQLGLKGNQFNIVLFYCICECPANLVLKKFRPSRWLPGITVIWGLVMTMMGLVKNYPQLLGARIALGIAEAGLFPGIVYYLTFWYPRHKLQTRISMFFGSASLAGAFSGLLAYGISFMSGVGGRLGWSWIFILEGLATIIIGFIAFFVLVDFPVSAKFLTPEERAFVIYQKKLENSGVGEEEHFELRHFWAAVTDWQVWLHTLIFMSVGAPLYGFTLFLPSIINGFGYSVTISQLLTIPPYVLATVAIYVSGYYSDKWRLRSPFIFGSLICSFITLSIYLSNVSRLAKYFGTFFIVTGCYAAFPGIVSWLGNNLSGQYKRGVGMAIQIGIGNFSGTFASNMYRTQDAPRYVLGNGLAMMFSGIGVICVVVAVLAYKHINHKRDKILQELTERGEKLSPVEIKRLGDKSPTFRYMI